MEGSVDTILRQMSLEEKAALVIGADRWHTAGFDKLNLPSVMMTDGPHGLRREESQADVKNTFVATCFPTASCLASSWDVDLLREVGQALGEEALEEKIDVILGPGANIKRSPLCGRNFEYYSEDPYLSGELAAALIEGIQSKGVGSSLKHFAANNQETNRMTIDAFIDERAFREIYLASFEKAVKQSRPWTVMCAYNKINGTFASEHQELLQEILRKEWGFEGLAVSDWGAVNDRAEGLKAGLDLEMPGPVPDHVRAIVSAVREGRLDEAVLDRSTARIIALALKSARKGCNAPQYDREAHHALAVKAAAESAVLLKNDSGLLPLGKGVKIALIGEFAKVPRYQGAGSSQVNPVRLDTAFEAGLQLPFHPSITYARGYDVHHEEISEELIKEAALAAAEADVAIVMAGLIDALESEGFDRKNMKMPKSHDALISRVAKANPRTVVVLCNGAPVEMPWINEVQTVLEVYLSGQGGGSALWQLLYGDANPSGKLAETFPKELSDTPCFEWFPMGPKGVEYRESLYVGYRYYDKAQVGPLFPFGHGLSYTSFAYSDLRLSSESLNEPGNLEVRFKIRNTGQYPGRETAQLYIRDAASTFFRPDKELKGFSKVHLEPGEEKDVCIRLDRRSFAFWHPAAKAWTVEAGDFEILIGASSRDIRLSKCISMKTGDLLPEARKTGTQADYVLPTGRWSIDQSTFEQLYGKPVIHGQLGRKGTFDANSTVAEIRSVFLGRCFAGMTGLMTRVMLRKADEKFRRMVAEQTKEMPLRFLVMNSNGMVSQSQLNGFILMLNGHFFKGLLKALKPSKKR